MKVQKRLQRKKHAEHLEDCASPLLTHDQHELFPHVPTNKKGGNGIQATNVTGHLLFHDPACFIFLLLDDVLRHCQHCLRPAAKKAAEKNPWKKDKNNKLIFSWRWIFQKSLENPSWRWVHFIVVFSFFVGVRNFHCSIVPHLPLVAAGCHQAKRGTWDLFS